MIKKDSKIAEVIEKYPDIIEVFIEAGFHCIGCAMAALETIEEGCTVHGIDADEFVEKLNKKIKKD